MREQGYVKAMETYRVVKNRKIVIIGGNLDAFHAALLLLFGPHIYSVPEDNENLVFFSKRLTDENIYQNPSKDLDTYEHTSDEDSPQKNQQITTKSSLYIENNKKMDISKRQSKSSSLYDSKVGKQSYSPSKGTPSQLPNTNASLFSIAKLNDGGSTTTSTGTGYYSQRKAGFSEKYKKFVKNITFGGLEKERFREVRKAKKPKFGEEEIIIVYQKDVHLYFRDAKEAKEYDQEFKVSEEPSSSSKKNAYLRGDARDLYFKVKTRFLCLKRSKRLKMVKKNALSWLMKKISTTFKVIFKTLGL